MNAAIDTVACPKCYAGYTAHKHIEGGICFLCDGAGKVERAVASRWMRGQVGGIEHTEAKYTGPELPPVKTAHRNYRSVGAVTITTRDGVNFCATLTNTGTLMFSVNAGKVTVSREAYGWFGLTSGFVAEIERKMARAA